ncbi:MAG: hypothetical protein ACI9NQ_000294, partial [Paracoccaceae bacterium]
MVRVFIFWREVGTPITQCPLADPGVRNYRTGLLTGRAVRASSVSGLLLIKIMQVSFHLAS